VIGLTARYQEATPAGKFLDREKSWVYHGGVLGPG
jgi:hypothetical protein